MLRTVQGYYSERDYPKEWTMIYTAHIQSIGAAGAGRMARRELVARAFPEGMSLPTFRKLRS